MRLNCVILAAIGIWGVSAMAISPVWASDCMRLCNPQFMQDASPSDIRAEINRGANINGRDDNLNTPLHFASFWGNDRAMRALLAAGANPEIADNAGRRPADLATLNPNLAGTNMAQRLRNR